MKRAIPALAAIVAFPFIFAGSCDRPVPLPNDRQACIEQGYEWEEDSSGGECEMDDDSEGMSRHSNTPRYTDRSVQRPAYTRKPIATNPAKNLTKRTEQRNVGPKPVSKPIKTK